jgi:tellurite methyltransferase
MTLQAKWDGIYRNRAVEHPRAAAVLVEFSHLLPEHGSALDLACGRGGNALLLARHGLDTWAWDISPVAVEQLEKFARASHLKIHVEVRDVAAAVFEPGGFDVIVVSRFLARSLCDAIMTALKPGGLLFYQTFTRAKVVSSGPSNPDFLLSENELLSLFVPLKILVYREEGGVGDVTQGLRNEALLIGQRRS